MTIATIPLYHTETETWRQLLELYKDDHNKMSTVYVQH
jgi:hypothetical protein